MTGFVKTPFELFIPINPDQIFLPPCWPHFINLNCKTRILWVMDGGLNMDATNGFALTEAKTIVVASSGTNYPVELTTAHRGNGTGCDVLNFRFDGTHTVNGQNRTISYYEEIWIFSISTNANELKTAEIPALETFMSNGGGVFATGDHADLGAGVCENIPRVKSMRKWRVSDGAPTGSGTTRIDTNVPSPMFSPDFDIQSDSLAQRIYPVWQGAFDNDYLPHPVLEMPNGKTVSHLPDHPHEGKCVVPSDLDATEYPSDNDGNQVSPELIAYGVSGGPGFSGAKPSITPPELFGILGAYDGHQAEIGRVVVDSTWHHWLNINLNGTGAGNINGVNQNGLYDDQGNPTVEYLEIQRYFQNIASWLEPNRFRICFIFWWFCLSRVSPFIEEFELLDNPTFDDFMSIGKTIEQSIQPFKGKSSLLELLDQVMGFVDGPSALRNTFKPLYKGENRLSIPQIIKQKPIVHVILGGAYHELIKVLPEDTEKAIDFIKSTFDKCHDQKRNPLLSALESGISLAMKQINLEFDTAGCFRHSMGKVLDDRIK